MGTQKLTKLMHNAASHLACRRRRASGCAQVTRSRRLCTRYKEPSCLSPPHPWQCAVSQHLISSRFSRFLWTQEEKDCWHDRRIKKTKCLSKRHAPLSCVIKTTKGRKVDPSSSSSWWKERRLSSRKDTKELNLYRVQSTVELSFSYCILAYSLNEGGKKR